MQRFKVYLRAEQEVPRGHGLRRLDGRAVDPERARHLGDGFPGHCYAIGDAHALSFPGRLGP
jgi:hypothetical protein